jgi:hypothetical protein
MQGIIRKLPLTPASTQDNTMRTKIAWAALVIVLGVAVVLLLEGKTLAAWLTGSAGFVISAAIAGRSGNDSEENGRG